MRKFLLSLAVATLAVPAVAETVTDVLTPTSLKLDGKSNYAVYTYTGNSGAEYYLQCSNGTDIQLRATSPSGLVVTNSPGTAKSVTIEWNTTTTANRQINFYTSSTPYTNSDALYASGITSVGNVKYTAGTTTNTFTFDDGVPYFGLRSNANSLYVASITVTWEVDGNVKTPAGLSFPEESYNATIGEEFTAPTLTNPYGLPVTYSSSEPAIASVDPSTGAVTPLSPGSTTVSAATEGNDDYAAGVASYNLIVKQAAAENTITEIITAADFTNLSTSYAANTFTSSVTGITYYAMAYKGNQNGNTVIQIRTSNSNEGVVVQENPQNYKVVSVAIDQTSASQINIYGSGTVYENSAALFKTETAGTQMGTITATYGQTDFTGDNYAWGVRSSSGARYINSITVVYEKPDGTLEPAGIAFEETEVTVELGSGFTGLTLTNPNSLQASYESSNMNVATVDATGTVSVVGVGSTVIKATTAATDEFASGSAQYTLNVTPAGVISVADAVKYINAGYTGVAQVKGYISEITEISTSYGNATYNIVDDLADESSFVTVYRGYYLEGEKFTSENQLEIGALVVVEGNLILYSGVTPEVATGNKLVSYEAPQEQDRVAAPVITPNGGSVVSGTMVEITCETEGATIYYTIDESDPTDQSLVYSDAIEITQATVIKAIAVKENLINSPVTTATFTVYDENATSGDFNFAEPGDLSTPIEKPADGKDISLANQTFTSNAVSITFSDVNSSKNGPRLYTTTGTNSGNVDLRLYQDNYFTVSVDENKYYITKIEFTKSGGSFAMGSNVGSFTASNGTWMPSSSEVVALVDGDATTYSSVTFTATGTTRIDTINVSYVQFDSSSAVDTLGNDDAETVYYNLQGVRVQNPDHGIYIVVKGNKTTKVVL